MRRVLTCLTVEHDMRLVAVAMLICLLTALVAISFFHRARVTVGKVHAYWIVAAALAGGCGVWATHFIAMLAYNPGIDISYDPTLTILSLVAAVAFMGMGLGIAAS